MVCYVTLHLRVYYSQLMFPFGSSLSLHDFTLAVLLPIYDDKELIKFDMMSHLRAGCHIIMSH